MIKSGAFVLEDVAVAAQVEQGQARFEPQPVACRQADHIYDNR